MYASRGTFQPLMQRARRTLMTPVVLVRAAPRTHLSASHVGNLRALGRALATSTPPPPPLSGAASVKVRARQTPARIERVALTDGFPPQPPITTAAPGTASAPPPPPPNPPSAPKPTFGKRWRGFLQVVGRVTLVSIVATGGVFYYVAYKDRTPGPQLPFDKTKKNLVILGTGWGATSVLKNIDTEDYNVVSPVRLDVFAGDRR